jgi:hypothetical protein
MVEGLRIFQQEDGQFCLTIMEPGGLGASYWKIFEEKEISGGGYTWEGLVDSLVMLKMPNANSTYETGAEADNAYITSADRGVLERIAAMIEEAVSDDRLLLQAIENADDLE